MNVRIANGAAQWVCSECPAVGEPLPLGIGRIQATIQAAKMQGQAHAAFAHPVSEVEHAR